MRKFFIILIFFRMSFLASFLAYSEESHNKAPGEPNTHELEKELEAKKSKDQSEEKPTTEEQKQETVNFNLIKDILKNDRLQEEVSKVEIEAKKKGQARKESVVKKYDIPSDDEFWGMFSEYWLVKNSSILKWDFERPDYGLETSFAEFLEKMGILEKKFKILIVDTPTIAHFALPTYSNEYLFILSLPFMRTLDLSKQEISLLLLEDIERIRLGHFENMAKSEELKKLMGTNFYGKKLDLKPIKNLLAKYDEIIFDKGFELQQQFEVTKAMDQTLRSDLKLWNMYLSLLKKIDDLVKTNLLYRKYIEIYPSPELQMNWLSPKKN